MKGLIIHIVYYITHNMQCLDTLKYHVHYMSLIYCAASV